MSTTNRELLIRSALTPTADLVVPAGLADQIRESLAVTPQRSRGWAAPIRRFLPEPPVVARPTVVWLTALLILALAVAAIVGVATRRDSALPDAVTNYHGRPSQDGIMPGPGPVGVPSVLDDVQLQGPLDTLGVPLVRDGIVYAADMRAHVTARDASDLSEIWTVDGPGPGSRTPVLLGEVLVVAGTGGAVVGLDTVTGEERWRTRLEATIEASLAGIDDRVLVGSADGGLVILSSVDGQPVATVDTRGPVRRSPAISDGIAYVAADSGVVTAFDPSTGAIRWHLDLAADDTITIPSPEVSTPIYADGSLYLVRGPHETETPHEVVAISIADHAVRWRSTSPSLARLFVGAVTDDAVYTVGEDGVIRVVDPATGAMSPLSSQEAGIGALPTIVGDTMFVSSYDGIVRALDRISGAERWRVQATGSATMPVVIDGRVIVGTDAGRLHSIGDPP